MNQKICIRDMIFELALMCRQTECEECELSWKDGAAAGLCKLRTATLKEIAQNYFETKGAAMDGIWIKFDCIEEALADQEEMAGMLRDSGPYFVRTYCQKERVVHTMQYRADEEIYQTLKDRYGIERVKMVHAPEKGMW